GLRPHAEGGHSEGGTRRPVRRLRDPSEIRSGLWARLPAEVPQPPLRRRDAGGTAALGIEPGQGGQELYLGRGGFSRCPCPDTVLDWLCREKAHSQPHLLFSHSHRRHLGGRVL